MTKALILNYRYKTHLDDYLYYQHFKAALKKSLSGLFLCAPGDSAEEKECEASAKGACDEEDPLQLITAVMTVMSVSE